MGPSGVCFIRTESFWNRDINYRKVAVLYYAQLELSIQLNTYKIWKQA